jgi:hypothetical protein
MVFKRFFVATGIFGCVIFLLILPGLIQVFSFFHENADVAFGLSIIPAPPAEMVAGFSILMVLAVLSYWLSGKLVKTA